MSCEMDKVVNAQVSGVTKLRYLLIISMLIISLILVLRQRLQVQKLACVPRAKEIYKLR